MLKVSLFVGAAIAALVQPIGSAAHAQEARAEADSNQSSDIIVTALKRSASVQDIPASISAISGDALRERGIRDIQDLAKAVPNLIFAPNFANTMIAIRGVGSTVYSGATEPTVALYVDGVYLPRSFMAAARAVDLERIEVLRGPQSTLYGRNATGGAINFISASPTKDFEGRAELSAGGRDAWGVSGYVSGPITEGVSVRVSGGREKADGFVKVTGPGPDVGGVNATYGRLAMRLEPSSSVRMDLAIRYDKDTAPLAVQQHIGPAPFGTEGVNWTTKPWRVITNRPYGGRNEMFIAQGGLSWEVSDSLTFKSLSSYVDASLLAELDDDGTNLPVFYSKTTPRNSKSFGQEFNITGSYGRLEFILGSYYFHEKYDSILDVILENTPTAGSETAFFTGHSAKINNYALYGDGSYSITDKLRLNLGLRLNYEDNSYGQIFGTAPGSGPATIRTDKVKTTKLLPKVALQYDFAPEVTSYLQWTRGYKSGGGNFPLSDGTPNPLYAPEQLDAFEFGVKAQLWDRILTANIAAFYYKYGGLQVEVSIPPIGLAVRTANAEVVGIEGDFRINPTRNLTLSVAPTWLRPVFKDFVSFDDLDGTLVQLDGGQLPNAPRFSVNAGAEQRFELGNDLLSELQLAANVRYSSTVILRYFNRNGFERQGGYTLLDLSASVTDSTRKTKMSAFVNNVTNKAHRLSSNGFGVGYIGNWGRPRTWGVRLSRSF